MGSRLLVWLLVISISAHAFAKRAKGGKAGKAVGGFGGPNLCESKDEFNKCKVSNTCLVRYKLLLE